MEISRNEEAGNCMGMGEFKESNELAFQYYSVLFSEGKRELLKNFT